MEFTKEAIAFQSSILENGERSKKTQKTLVGNQEDMCNIWFIAIKWLHFVVNTNTLPKSPLGPKHGPSRT